MSAQPGQREIQQIADEAGNRGPGDDGGLVPVRPEVDDDVTLADHGEAEVETVAGDREQVAAHRQGGDVRDIVRGGAEGDGEVAAGLRQEQAVAVIGVPVGHVLDDLAALAGDIEGEVAGMGRGDRRGDDVAVDRRGDAGLAKLW